MGRYDGGFFTLERRLLTEFAGDPDGYNIWTWLIGRAFFKPGTATLFGKRTTIERGQLITTAEEIAVQWAMPVSTVKRRLATFVKDGFITQATRHKTGRLITILNYDKYQFGLDAYNRINNDVNHDNDESNNSHGAAGERQKVDLGDKWANRRTDGERNVSDSVDDSWANDAHADIGNDESNNSHGAAGERLVGESLGDKWAIGGRLVGDKWAPLDNKGTSNNSNKEQPFRLGAVPPAKASGAAPTVSEKAAALKLSKSGAVLDAYLGAHRMIHGGDLRANAQLRSQACTLVDRVGKDDAPEIAEWYVVNERTAWIVQARHPFGELLKNWAKYHTNWKTKTKISTGLARTIDRNDGNQTAVDRYLAKKHGINTGA